MDLKESLQLGSYFPYFSGRYDALGGKKQATNAKKKILKLYYKPLDHTN